jgi:acyl carrier protein
LPSGAYNPSLTADPGDVAVGTVVHDSTSAVAAEQPISLASAQGRGMEEEIRGFLADIFFLGEDPASLPKDKSLITAGIIDSTGVLELVGFLEEHYEIRIDDEELLPENLDTVENIVHFVSRKRGSA